MMDYHFLWSILVFPFVLAFGLVGFLIGLVTFIFWIWMLVDAIQRKFKNPNDKIIWILVIVFTHFIGALIYYFIVKKAHEHR